MKFPWRIIGHQKVLERLEEEIAKGRLSHAYLFCGPKEIGKFRLAKTFAQLLQCSEKNICRRCTDCLQLSRNLHPGTIVVDRLWMKDQAEDFEMLAKYSNFDQSHRKKEGKKSDQIGIEDVLSFIEPLFQKSASAFKICLIRDIERMTTAAMNTLLKILEEPPEKTIFLLTTTHRNALLPTILSRTRTFDLHLVPNSVLTAAFTEISTSFSTAKEHLLTLAQGRPARLLRLTTDTAFLRSQEELFQDLAQMLGSENLLSYFQTAERLAKIENQDFLHEFFDAITHFLRTLLREKAAGKELSLGRHLSLPKILQMLAAVETAAAQLDRNVNKRMALEAMFLAWDTKPLDI